VKSQAFQEILKAAVSVQTAKSRIHFQPVTVVSTGGGLTGSVVTNDEIIAFALPKK
jgi:hypothetical protein